MLAGFVGLSFDMPSDSVNANVMLHPLLYTLTKAKGSLAIPQMFAASDGLMDHPHVSLNNMASLG